VVCTAGRVWMPLAAERTPANAADNLQAPGLFQKFHMELRFLLGDHHDRGPDLEQLCTRRGCLVMTPTGGGTRLQGEWKSVSSFSVEPGEIGLTALKEARDGIDQDTKGRLAELATGLAQR
jgi:hypothetical protein